MNCIRVGITGLIISCVCGCATPHPAGAETLSRQQGVSTEALSSNDAGLGQFKEQFILLSRDFSEICLHTGLEPKKVAERAETSGWFRSNEQALQGTNKADWSSFPPQQIAEKGQLPFILELIDGRDDESGIVQCSITMWGNGAEPEVGRNEMTLIREILSEDYVLDDVKELSPDSSDATRASFHQFSFNFSESESDEQVLAYLWAGGTHRLIAARSYTAQ